MAIIVEDGTRPTGANSYASIETADAYHAARSNATWGAASDAEKEVALIKSADYLNGLSWSGRKVAQRIMAWPRVDVVDGDGYSVGSGGVPDQIADACCYMAGEFLAGADPLAAQGRALSEMTVGAVSLKYAAGSSLSPQYPALKAILRGFLLSSSSIRLVRA